MCVLNDSVSSQVYDFFFSYRRKKEGLNLLANWGLSVWSLYVLPVLMWISSECTGFLPQPKDIQIN